MNFKTVSYRFSNYGSWWQLFAVCVIKKCIRCTSLVSVISNKHYFSVQGLYTTNVYRFALLNNNK